jgi:DNA topoisomerase-1
MAKNLVIVESPAKAKTIEKYLGQDYTVKSSMGHVRGLPSKPGSVDVTNGYAPKYVVDPDKKKVITGLKAAAKSAEVWLASDEDREGEAIAWHLAEVLGLDPKTTKRIVFHEITGPALEHAVKNPRVIDLALVESQQARQMLDYLVGFELSPVLWRKVQPGLSAGRVQSVAVRLVVEREREIEAHEVASTFKISAEFKLSDGTSLTAEASKSYDSAEEVKQTMQAWVGDNFHIQEVDKKPGTRNPSPPFTTSTLQQAASNRLGMSPRQTMRLAQQLYEAGLITYMRTDSLNLSPLATGQMNKYIVQKYGKEYAQERHFKTSSAGAQEAHEAIRPTDVTVSSAGGDERQKKLYNLIWRRALASQMSAAKLEKTTIKIKSENSNEQLTAAGAIITFEGFIKLYGRSGEDTLLPPVQAGDKLELVGASSQENLSRGPARYTEASLIRELEKRGIGRPSTYAPTIATIQARGYVERGDVAGTPRNIQILELANGKVSQRAEEVNYGKDTDKLMPTSTGLVVTDFLTKNFAYVMDYDFTKEIEAELDGIAEKHKGKLQVLDNFYKPFHKLVESSESVSRAEANQARQLGNDPKSGRPIYARFGRYGPMLQKGDKDDEQKPEFAPMPSGARIESITLDEALKMFQLPREVGQTSDGQPIVANIGRFGPYVKVGSTFISIKPFDPFSITEDEAKKLYDDKLKQIAEKNIAEFSSGLKVLNGRFGPYVTDGTKNARVPKDVDPKKLDEAAARELLAKSPSKKRYRRPKK